MESLRARSKDVLYEIQMLAALAGYLRSGEVDHAVAHLSQNGLPVRNALIESFAMHARQLTVFLESARSFSTDLAAEDFAGKGWEPQRSADGLDWPALRKRVNKEIAHLTEERADLSPGRRRWHADEVFRDLADALRQFVASANPDRLCDGFQVEAQAALPLAHPGHMPLPIRPSSDSAGTATVSLRQQP